MSLAGYQRIVLLGIGGAGMRGLAIILAHQGATIWGVDREDPQLPTQARITFFKENEPGADESIKAADLVIHTDAVSIDHPLLAVARAAARPTMVYHEALGSISQGMRTLAVTGTHGKSSTTSMLAHIFVAEGLDPTALVGAPVPAWEGMNARVGNSKWFIVEADEYREHFLAIQAESAIITAIDYDHPDFFTSLSDVESSFSKFLRKLSSGGALIVPAGIVQRWQTIPWPANTRAVGPPPTPIDLVLPGEHMQYNAWLAIAMAGVYGIDEAAARAALANYPGLGRRFELLGRVGAMDVVSDYGHHPREIEATLAAARSRYGETRICTVFEAHTGERLVHFFDAFCDALALADAIVLVPSFVPPGREGEHPSLKDTEKRLAECLKSRGKEVYEVKELAQISNILTSLSDRHALALGFSAGSLDGILRTCVKKE